MSLTLIMAEVFPILDVGQACFVATWRSNRRRQVTSGDFSHIFTDMKVEIRNLFEKYKQMDMML